VDTTATSANYPAVAGEQYTFHMVATDRAGNASTPEEVTIVARLQTIRLPLIMR
jgi:hypothetical protein